MSAPAMEKQRVKTGQGPKRGPSLPPGKTMVVHSADGTRLHTEVFGPANGYPIVLAHGITCSLQAWHEQINDLSRDFRVIAYDHRGHGRSGVPAPSAYSLDHLAADLDAVLAAVLRPGERAVIAGHSMGGIAISAWSDRFRDRVQQRADAHSSGPTPAAAPRRRRSQRCPRACAPPTACPLLRAGSSSRTPLATASCSWWRTWRRTSARRAPSLSVYLCGWMARACREA